MTTASAKDLLSLGILSSQLSASVREIERAADALKIRPALRLNGVAHFDRSQCEAIAAAIQKSRAKQ